MFRRLQTSNIEFVFCTTRRRDSTIYRIVKEIQFSSKNKVTIGSTSSLYVEYGLIIVEEGNKLGLFTAVRIIYFTTDYVTGSCQIKKRCNFQINLLGAEKVDEEFILSLYNRTPYILNITGRNHQQHTIKRTKEPDYVLWKRKMVAIARSGFMI